MSRASDLLTGGKGMTRASYLREVAAEILSGPPADDGYQSTDMVRGRELEHYARLAYEAASGKIVTQIGFATIAHGRIGASPDGLIHGGEAALEIKCPRPKNHLRYLARAQVERDHGAQLQGVAWVLEVPLVDFVSFCPEVSACPLIIHTIARDDDLIRRITDSAIYGITEIDKMVAEVRSLGSPSAKVRAIADEAAKYWSTYYTADAEVIFDD